MEERIVNLAKYRIEKAETDLEAAKLLLANNLFAQSLNRSYYAIFHAARALLAFDKFDSKKHSGIIAYFNQKYINTGMFGKEYSKIIMSAERIRNKSDYSDFYFATKQEAESQMRQAEKFVEGVRQFIRRHHQVE
jgi:hypothetical protein